MLYCLVITNKKKNIFFWMSDLRSITISEKESLIWENAQKEYAVYLEWGPNNRQGEGMQNWTAN